MKPEWAVCEGVDVRADEGPFLAADGSKKRLSCRECGRRLEFKKYKRGETQVRLHFQHHGGGQVTCEGAAHKTAKSLAATKDFRWLVRASCGHLHRLELPGTPLACERQWTFEGRRYQLDVPLVDDGRVVGAIEVHDSHECSDTKRADMTRGLQVWIEVEAADLLAWKAGCFNDVVAKWHMPVDCDARCRCTTCQNLLTTVGKRTSWYYGSQVCEWCPNARPLKRRLDDLVVAQYSDVADAWDRRSWHGRLPVDVKDDVHWNSVRKILRSHEREL